MVQEETGASSSNLQSISFRGVGSWQSDAAPPRLQSIDDPELPTYSTTQEISYRSCQTCLYPSFFGNDSRHFNRCGDFDQFSLYCNDDWDDPPTSQLVCEPSIYGVSQEQLIAEVKGIYADLHVVQMQCAEIDSFQNTMSLADAVHFNQEQWEAMAACLRETLRGHHESFLRSPLPSAKSALVRVLSKHIMPLRLWVDGTYNPFKDMRDDDVPSDLKHMLSLISLSYSMAALMNDMEKRTYHHQITLLTWLKRTASILNWLLKRFQQLRPELVIGAMAFFCQFSEAMMIWTLYWIRPLEFVPVQSVGAELLSFNHQREHISDAKGKH